MSIKIFHWISRIKKSLEPRNYLADKVFSVDHAEDAAVRTFLRVVAGQVHSAVGFDRQEAFDHLKGFERMVGKNDVAFVDRGPGIDENLVA